ncbi:MAG: hypothetical protein JM58_15480 [Peptococcaceae bacterium BICA1-8]|nr:MAG: hypothetical protein JM58_15480 [Peptococcaceae bacterium BICA1-8]
MKICTFNIQHCVRTAPGLIGKYIKELNIDIAVLQEVDKYAARSNYIDQVEVIKENAGMGFAAFYSCLKFKDGGEYGIALLTKNTPISIEVLNLSVKGDREPRGAILLKTADQNKEFYCCGTHLSTISKYAKMQLEKTLYSLENRKLPWILAGDFNIEDTKELRPDASFEANSLPTWPVDNPQKKIDHVLCSETFKNRVKSQVVCNEALSDHCILVANF